MVVWCLHPCRVAFLVTALEPTVNNCKRAICPPRVTAAFLTAWWTTGDSNAFNPFGHTLAVVRSAHLDCTVIHSVWHWHNAGVPSPFLNKRCRLLYVQWQCFVELVRKTDYFPDLWCFINWILYQLFCDSTWSLRFFTSRSALLVLCYWHNCEGQRYECLRRALIKKP